MTFIITFFFFEGYCSVGFPIFGQIASDDPIEFIFVVRYFRAEKIIYTLYCTEQYICIIIVFITFIV